MIRKIDHVAVAVPDLEQALSFWSDALGLKASEIETVESEQVKMAFLPLGATRIELLEAITDESPVARFVQGRGGGIHHLTLEVSDLPLLLEQLGERGVKVLGDGMRVGAGGRQVAFLHPKSAGGVLVELVAADEPEPRPRDVVPGEAVLLYLRDPQEKLWGVLQRLDTNGAVLEGLDLGSFDTWMGQVERDESDIIGPSIFFVPMTRVEKILLDRPSGPLPSMAERFEQRIGRTVQEQLDAD
jgi:methylmalonyl-CoA/ethylmalonyl-CoA epimerase